MGLYAILAATLLLVAAPPAPSDDVVQVVADGIDDVLPGMVRARHEVTIGSPFDTLLGDVRVMEGDVVRAGDVLAVLDDRVARASVRAARQEASRTARIHRAQALLELAQDELHRIESALTSGAATDLELARAQSNHRVALADLWDAIEAYAQAQRRLDLAEVQLDEHTLRAPFDGVVHRVLVEPGAMLSTGEAIVELASVASMCVDLHLPAPVAVTLECGGRYALDVEGPVSRTATGRVRHIEQRIDPVSGTMRVVFDLEAPVIAGALVRPAATVPASVAVAGDDAN